MNSLVRGLLATFIFYRTQLKRGLTMDLRDIADLRFANRLTKLVVSFFRVQCNGFVKGWYPRHDRERVNR
jgi:hypothetical protein